MLQGFIQIILYSSGFSKETQAANPQVTHRQDSGMRHTCLFQAPTRSGYEILDTSDQRGG